MQCLELDPLRRCPDGRARVRGFTLIELLIIIAIVATLSSIGLVKYRSAVRIARYAKCGADLRTISQAIDMYRLTNGFDLPSTLYDVGFGGRIDPWGSPYMYLNFETGTGTGAEFVLANGLIDPAATTNWNNTKPSQRSGPAPNPPPSNQAEIETIKRKDKFLFPLNSDYDLFSLGPNRKAWASVAEGFSLDDVIRANDGDYIGIASAY